MPRDGQQLDNEVGTGEKPDGIAYFCARCGSLITRPRWAIRMNGDHEHVVFNPAGMVFRVVCFQDAPGVEPVGPSSDAFTWFRSYRWQLARCRGCASHMGWFYQGAGPPAAFFGLIRPMLVERPG